MTEGKRTQLLIECVPAGLVELVYSEVFAAVVTQYELEVEYTLDPGGYHIVRYPLQHNHVIIYMTSRAALATHIPNQRGC